MTKQIRINQGELAELLQGDVDFTETFFNEDTGTMQIVLEWCDVFRVILEHCHHQIYKIVFSESEMVEGHTISVDEILDIVL